MAMPNQPSQSSRAPRTANGKLWLWMMGNRRLPEKRPIRGPIRAAAAIAAAAAVT
jgi:hypothetical protein